MADTDSNYCRLNKLRARSADSEGSADGPGSPRSPVNLRSISLVERSHSAADSRGDEQGASKDLKTVRQMSVSAVPNTLHDEIDKSLLDTVNCFIKL